MSISYESKLRNNLWDELSALYAKAGFEGKTTERLSRVFGNSQFQTYAYDEDALIGVARAFSDDGDCAVVCDVAVSPEYQGRGIGRAVVKHLLDQIPAHERVMLFATQGLEPFYESFGFGVLTTGMCKFKDQQKAIDSGLILSKP